MSPPNLNISRVPRNVNPQTPQPTQPTKSVPLKVNTGPQRFKRVTLPNGMVVDVPF